MKTLSLMRLTAVAAGTLVASLVSLPGLHGTAHAADRFTGAARQVALAEVARLKPIQARYQAQILGLPGVISLLRDGRRPPGRQIDRGLDPQVVRRRR